jgi:hypothetical protein
MISFDHRILRGLILLKLPDISLLENVGVLEDGLEMNLLQLVMALRPGQAKSRGDDIPYLPSIKVMRVVNTLFQPLFDVVVRLDQPLFIKGLEECIEDPFLLAPVEAGIFDGDMNPG